MCDVCEQMGDLLMRFSLCGGEGRVCVRNAHVSCSLPSLKVDTAAGRTDGLIPIDVLQRSLSTCLSTLYLLPWLLPAMGSLQQWTDTVSWSIWGWSCAGCLCWQGWKDPSCLSHGTKAGGPHCMLCSFLTYILTYLGRPVRH